MAKRIKRVFSGASEVMHRWANQVQDSARSSNVFFEGDSIYSYGHHYLLGRLHKVGNKTVAVINSTRYSNTTAKHQSWATYSVSHLPTVKSSDPNSIETGLKEMQADLIDRLMSFFSQRRFWKAYDRKDIMDYYVKSTEKFNKVCLLVGRKDLQIVVTDEFIDLMVDHTKLVMKKKEFSNTPEELAKKQAKRKKEQSAKHAKLLIDLETDITAWRNHGNITWGIRGLTPQLLRVKTEIATGKQFVETTKGATVSLEAAKALLKRVLDKQAKQGEKIDGFTLNSVQGNLVRISCHTIDINEAIKVLEVA